MKKLTTFLIVYFVAAGTFSQSVRGVERSGAKTYVNQGRPTEKFKQPQTPDQIWGNLFVDVQLKRALGDNKSFVDALPKTSPAIILAKYQTIKKTGADSATLRKFVFENFEVPVSVGSKVVGSKTLKQHLEALWPTLTRKADITQPYSSLLPLPKAYVVPGGRFREIYYWDSYFTMLGLAVSNRYDLIENMLDNFSFLISRYGHIPNGNRSYYLSRSQPPYFAMMVQLLQQKKGNAVYRKYLPAMMKEYKWWMEGETGLRPGSAHRRVVRMAEGEIVNRYWDDKKAPREESYYEDVQNGLAYTGTDRLVYTHLRAGAESGWDFSSRWFADTFNLTAIETTNIIPVDLNCLLYKYESILASASKATQQDVQAARFTDRANKRSDAIQKYCWNEKAGYFFDYNFTKASPTHIWSLAGVLPLFMQVATHKQAELVQTHIQNKFLKDGGLVTTIYHTGQQWDAPNGWAPLQFLAVQGLVNYRYTELAQSVAERWMRINETVYAGTGKMLEKYNIENIHLESGGGEYPTQDGFGWSNGVYLKFYQMFRSAGNAPKAKQ
ncbi:alpha,alpha-trehalase TreA [Segetibacter sp. 3557_3]|uniref:alpha,alpha-trehalase TreA n=1 Tax=Segetibacter sp. 3557_3 TaxID=2547429 RepID=UPI0010585092|nr:alpha,alpha-trehalase TreA [Segetibacter sp. 3557_3]TDH29210.1 alpha,alpha-trehalase TreA [Segetibacter sp. 3557_3]